VPQEHDIVAATRKLVNERDALMSAIEVILPKVDMDMESGAISVWKVAEGALVNQGDIIFEMETDKAVMEVEAPGTGVIRDLAPVTGEQIPVGTTIAWIHPRLCLSMPGESRGLIRCRFGKPWRRPTIRGSTAGAIAGARWHPQGGVRMTTVSRRNVILACARRRRLGAGSAAAQAPGGKLVLYTSQPERDAAQTVAAFKKAQPGVEVDVFRSGTTEVMGKLAAEFAAGAPRADVLLLADAATMEALKKDGRLLAYREAKIDWPGSGHLRRRPHILRLQAHHHRHRGQHRGKGSSHVVGRSREAGVQGPDRDAEPALLRCRGDHARHHDESSGSWLELFREAQGGGRRRRARQWRRGDRQSRTARSRMACWSISWRSTRRRRARPSTSSFPPKACPR
jgi:hypothetical protein